jgi:Ca2+-binding RTX toxin-like protein
VGLLLEEIGHKLDRVFNGDVDSPGDEGDIFSRLASGQKLSPEMLASLKLEDDRAVITVDGKAISIEQAISFPIIGTDRDDILMDGDVFNLDRDIYGRSGNDRLYGYGGNDKLYGEADNDKLYGGYGNDTLDGGTGNDFLFGEDGNDKLYGGNGNDRFYFGSGAPLTGTATVATMLGKDIIGDFVSGIDKIVLNKSTFTSITNAFTPFGAPANFATVTNDAAALAGTSSAAILYSSSTGNLFYNQNGTLAGLGTSGGNFATLTGLPNLVVNDFVGLVPDFLVFG